MVQTVSDWIKSERPPRDFYELLGRRRFDPALDELRLAVKKATRELHHYQNHRDAAIAQRAMRLQWELGRAADVLADVIKLNKYHGRLLRLSRTEYAERHAHDADAWEPSRLQLWLEQEQDVHPARSRVLAAALSLDHTKTAEQGLLEATAEVSATDAATISETYELMQEPAGPMPASEIMPEEIAWIADEQTSWSKPAASSPFRHIATILRCVKDRLNQHRVVVVPMLGVLIGLEVLYLGSKLLERERAKQELLQEEWKKPVSATITRIKSSPTSPSEQSQRSTDAAPASSTTPPNQQAARPPARTSGVSGSRQGEEQPGRMDQSDARQQNDPMSGLFGGMGQPKEVNPTAQKPKKQDGMFYTVQSTGKQVVLIIHNTPLGDRTITFDVAPGAVGVVSATPIDGHMVVVAYYAGSVESVSWDRQDVPRSGEPSFNPAPIDDSLDSKKVKRKGNTGGNSVRSRARATPGQLSDKLAAYLNKLNAKDRLERLRAAEALGKLGPEAQAAVESLINLLKDQDQDAEVRKEAAHALGRIGPEADAAVPALIDALKEENASIRVMAALALRGIGAGDESAFAALADALRDQDFHVRFWAARALLQIGPDADVVVSALRAATKDDKDLVRIAAQEALKRITISAEDLFQPPASQEREATHELDKAMNLLKNNQGSKAREALKAISAKYPGTLASDEAMILAADYP